MKFKIFLFCLFCLFCLPCWEGFPFQGSLLYSNTYHIKQDGTGNFTTIQEGIIAASDNDTVLVYPGTYFENIDYLEKSLTVASLYIIIPEDSLISQTIIDGNQQARCVKIDECEDASIVGFTIQNGYSCESGQNQYGGGIYLRNTSNALISNCRIKDNKAYSGGGLHINHGNTVLKKNTISNNWGVRFGGGISVYGNDTVLQFDFTDLNNIYFNYSSTGSDISITEVVPPMDIYVDTLTVSEPDYFFVNPSHKYTFYGQNSKIDQIDQDLYVSPDGNDNNSGLGENDPLQTISWAQTLIKRNDENPNTIHLASGIYSPSLNNQKYPLNIKHGVKYIGISPEETILDAEEQTPFIRFLSQENLYVSLTFQNLTLRNGTTLPVSSAGAIYVYYQVNLNLNNIIIENCFGEFVSAILSNDGFYTFNNVCIKDNIGGVAISIEANHQNPNPVLSVSINKSIINNNLPGSVEDGGGGIILDGHLTIQGDYYAEIINCELSCNHSDFYNSQTGLGGSSGLYIGHNLITDIINCTFGNNTLSYNTGCVIGVNNSELNLYNSILYNNDGYSFNLWEGAVVNISHSLIEDGDDNVNYYYPLATVNWLEGNIDENPMFDSLGTYPFALKENSPCIDAGTLDLPAGIELPEFDLAGNPRIYGESIDMGAYEFQGDPQSIDENEIIIPEIIQISNYPNPFNPSTTIKLNLAESGKIELAIYNIKGQKVKTLMDAYSAKGYFEIIWRGIDDNGKSISSGNYFIKLKVNDEEKIIRKCVLLK